MAVRLLRFLLTITERLPEISIARLQAEKRGLVTLAVGSRAGFTFTTAPALDTRCCDFAWRRIAVEAAGVGRSIRSGANGGKEPRVRLRRRRLRAQFARPR